MTCIANSVITYELNNNPLVKPITQKKTLMCDEKKLTIHVKVGKLINDNFVKENMI